MATQTAPILEQPVPIGRLVVCPVPAVLTVYGLGSCVVIFLHHPDHRIGGLAHALLPSGKRSERERTPGKFVPSSVEVMLQKFDDLGVRGKGLVAKLVGGASMFVGATRERHGIGERNIRAAQKVLAEHGIPVVASDTGGHSGRSLRAYTQDGLLEVSTLRQPPQVL